MNLTLYYQETGQTKIVTVESNQLDELQMLVEAYFNIISEDQLFWYNSKSLYTNFKIKMPIFY